MSGDKNAENSEESRGQINARMLLDKIVDLSRTNEQQTSKMKWLFGINSDLRNMKTYHEEWQVHNRELRRMNKALERKARRVRKLREDVSIATESILAAEKDCFAALADVDSLRAVIDGLRADNKRLELQLLAEQDPTAWKKKIIEGGKTEA